MPNRTVFRALALAVVLCALWAGAACAQGFSDAGNDPAVLERAARGGDAKARYVLGGMYYQGQGVPQDYAKAAALFQKAADQGYAKAQAFLGEMYIRGWGVTTDTEKGCDLLRDAVAKGGVSHTQLWETFRRYCPR